ncbi:hypothetical protein BZM27_32925 [Paraburkholderia steynii]|uniref:DUF1289 domain-containing protein n=1 Tax=Paraburkholderia steynii TaxID=1245441 RepID=A0A4R0XF36_9BURK|nr:hypothetical protein BZM27_32925 [Paraburkholderia steynii]
MESATLSWRTPTAVNSPCVDVCRIDSKSGLCVGCFRTRDKIRGGKNMSDHRRHQAINDRSSPEAKLRRETQDSSARAENPTGGTQ